MEEVTEEDKVNELQAEEDKVKMVEIVEGDKHPVISSLENKNLVGKKSKSKNRNKKNLEKRKCKSASKRDNKRSKLKK